MKKLIIGTRKSRMAIAQTNEFINNFLKANPKFNKENIKVKTVNTSGDINQFDRLDLVGGKGLFIKEIEQMLLNKEIDVAVHSMKDMPTIMTPGTKISAWLPRGDHHEALISNEKKTIKELQPNSVIGTSSIRRRSQILHKRNDLVIKLIRGNVDTRIKKLERKEYDALILGYGGIKRLNFEKKVTQIFSTNEILPPACQASIGLQTTEADNEFTNLILNTNHEHSSIVGITERKVLELLGANCNSPIGVNASIKDTKIYLKAELLSHNGKEKYDAKGSAKITDYLNLAKKIAGTIVDQVGINYIKKLDVLKDDFNYTP